jgi:hypothetical protein
MLFQTGGRAEAAHIVSPDSFTASSATTKTRDRAVLIENISSTSRRMLRYELATPKACRCMQSVTDRPRELVIRSRLDETQQVLVSVTDCGVGISAENADRLFNAFFTTKSGGMGMGLSICRSIMEAHGGRLSACGNEGPGATFQFVLPVHQEEAS